MAYKHFWKGRSDKNSSYSHVGPLEYDVGRWFAGDGNCPLGTGLLSQNIEKYKKLYKCQKSTSENIKKLGEVADTTFWTFFTGKDGEHGKHTKLYKCQKTHQ